MTHIEAPATYKKNVLFYQNDIVEFKIGSDKGRKRRGEVLYGSNAGFNGLTYVVVEHATNATYSNVPSARIKLIERTTDISAISHQNGWNPATGRMDH